MSLPNAAGQSPPNAASQQPTVVGVVGQPSSNGSSDTSDSVTKVDTAGPFIERRRQRSSHGNAERRQFGSSHKSLSEEGRELALAIDEYKLQHHRRYITCDEMLFVITRLGYSKTSEVERRDSASDD